MKRKYRIAVIGAKGFPAWGGAARANEAIFTRLKDQYEITNYAISSHAQAENYQGIKQIIFKAHKNLKFSVFQYYIMSALHALFNGSYDVIQVNHGSSGYIIPLLRIKHPVVLTLRGDVTAIINTKWNRREKWLFSLFQKIGLKFASKIVTVQKTELPSLQKLYNSKVTHIPNGVDDNTSNINFLLENEYDIVFSAARIYYLKGLHLLVQALNQLNFKGKLLVVGDLNHEKNYKEKIMNMIGDLRCDFSGLITDKQLLFKKICSSKLFVFPSYNEGMSNMLLEVASLKVPIIASDIPQNTDVFSGDEVLFFKSGCEHDLKVKIQFALANNSVLQENAEKAYKKVITHHNWDIIAQQYSDLYQRCMKIM